MALLSNTTALIASDCRQCDFIIQHDGPNRLGLSFIIQHDGPNRLGLSPNQAAFEAECRMGKVVRCADGLCRAVWDTEGARKAVHTKSLVAGGGFLGSPMGGGMGGMASPC